MNIFIISEELLERMDKVVTSNRRSVSEDVLQRTSSNDPWYVVVENTPQYSVEAETHRAQLEENHSSAQALEKRFVESLPASLRSSHPAPTPVGHLRGFHLLRDSPENTIIAVIKHFDAVGSKFTLEQVSF